MNFLDRFLDSYRRRNDDPVLHTPHGDFNLAKAADRRRLTRTVIELQRTSEALARRDIADWRAAWQSALDYENPSRTRLYDIYRDVDADLHLSGCIAQRRGFVMARSFKLVDASGDKHPEAAHFFDQPWFKRYLELCLESRWWGHSLIELGEVVTDADGCPCYSGVSLMPRKHVVPEYHRVIKNVGDDWRDGSDYTAEPYTPNYIEAGVRDDLGLYLKAAQQTIPKKHALSFWDAFAEIFGMPMRIARTTTRDPAERRRLERMMYDAASNLAVVTGMETEIEFVESGKGDAFNVYDKRVDRANSELSKLSIGQTMTIEDGSSLSQSKTHLEVFMNLVESDRDMLRDNINNELIPRMVRHGFPLQGLRFEWDDAIDYTPEQQVSYETMVADRYEVDPSYFADKYGMPVGRRISIMPPSSPDGDGGSGDNAPGDDGGKGGSRAHSARFFD